MKKDYISEAVKAWIEKLKREVVTFYAWRYLPDDIFEMNPYRCKVRGTLITYEKDFGRPYLHHPANQFLLFWDVEMEEWRTIRVKNLIIEGGEG